MTTVVAIDRGLLGGVSAGRVRLANVSLSKIASRNGPVALVRMAQARVAYSGTSRCEPRAAREVACAVPVDASGDVGCGRLQAADEDGRLIGAVRALWWRIRGARQWVPLAHEAQRIAIPAYMMLSRPGAARCARTQLPTCWRTGVSREGAKQCVVTNLINAAGLTGIEIAIGCATTS